MKYISFSEVRQYLSCKTGEFWCFEQIYLLDIMQGEPLLFSYAYKFYKIIRNILEFAILSSCTVCKKNIGLRRKTHKEN